MFDSTNGLGVCGRIERREHRMSAVLKWNDQKHSCTYHQQKAEYMLVDIWISVTTHMDSVHVPGTGLQLGMPTPILVTSRFILSDQIQIQEWRTKHIDLIFTIITYENASKMQSICYFITGNKNWANMFTKKTLAAIDFLCFRKHRIIKIP